MAPEFSMSGLFHGLLRSAARLLPVALLAVAMPIFDSPPAAAAELAKDLFGSKPLPAALPAKSYGFYSKGCFSGGIAIANDGPHWQAMRPSRNRRWGHPTMVALLEKLSREAVADGWPGLLLGDISQPRGGPMASGHASHQVGLDFDVWLRPMPSPRLTVEQRETFPFRSVLKKGTFTVDDGIWNGNYLDLIKLAANQPEVQRIFVNPGIKKKLCETAGRDRAWMSKVRPFYGHDEHFHIRLFCQPGSPDCKPQQAIGRGDGCDELDWWFNVALQPPPPDVKPPKPKPPLMLSGMPRACSPVLDAPDRGGVGAIAETPAGGGYASAYAPAPQNVPVPTPRPLR